MAGYKRLTINVSPELHEELVQTAEERGITVTELIRRAVALDRYIWKHKDAELLVKDGDVVRELVIL